MTLITTFLFSLLLVWLVILTFLYIKLFRSLKIRRDPVSSAGLHLGLVKFSPFSDTGGDQSFVISLLDGGGNGILITSLHGRGVTRLYAKKVSGGKTDQPLSVEEKQALKEALE